jgi:hypothetical protein
VRFRTCVSEDPRRPPLNPCSIGLALLLAASTIHLTSIASRAQELGIAALRESFKAPPPDTRIMMRWWWFGPAVSKAELKRELEQMQAAGIGGVEIANLYPLRLDDPSTGFHNQPFLSDEHIASLRYAAEEARRLGLRVDITLGSGWPYGGPHIPITQNAGVLRIDTAAVNRHDRSVALPDISSGEKLIAAFAVPTPDGAESLADAKQIPTDAASMGRLQLPTDQSSAEGVIFFIASRTGMVVKRPSVGAEGFVLDHYDPAAIANHVHTVGERLLEAFPDQPPYAIFSDSLEVVGSNWTGDYLKEFRNRRGYDLIPHLPALIGDVGPQTEAVRHDWGKTLSELVELRYLQPLQQWAHEHHTQLRAQNYGNPPVTLNSYRFADLIEGEGQASPTMWREFSWTRWAASAGHLLARSVVSSETWTWLHSPSFRAIPLDMKAEADLHFLQGINQLIGHGWPYSPESELEPGQRMYAAAAFNAHNPWFFAMPEVAAYLQRVSFALRQGKPSANVALYMPNDGAWASFNAARRLASSANPVTGSQAPRASASPQSVSNTGWGNASLDGSIRSILSKTLIGTILDAGFSLDFIDPSMITTIGVRYSVLVLPDVKRIDLAVYRKIEQYAQSGGVVIALGNAPSVGPGLVEEARDTSEIKTISQLLFVAPGHLGHRVADESALASDLGRFAKPEVIYAATQSDIGFLHRKLSDGDLYFVANTSNQPRVLNAVFAHTSRRAEWWDALTGEITPVRNPATIEETLEPYGSRLIFFSDAGAFPARLPAHSSHRAPMVQLDLSTDWTLTVGQGAPEHLQSLHSWTDEPKFHFYSGTATYEKQITVSKRQTGGGGPLFLDFGQVEPESITTTGGVIRTRAFLEAPIRDVAEVWINDQKVGVLWHPPYRIDIAKQLHPGSNSIRIRVANTAINELAGESQPDYRLLRSLYGNAFQPQDMDHLEPLPSGIVGPVTLHSEAR